MVDFMWPQNETLPFFFGGLAHIWALPHIYSIADGGILARADDQRKSGLPLANVTRHLIHPLQLGRPLAFGSGRYAATRQRTERKASTARRGIESILRAALVRPHTNPPTGGDLRALVIPSPCDGPALGAKRGRNDRGGAHEPYTGIIKSSPIVKGGSRPWRAQGAGRSIYP